MPPMRLRTHVQGVGELRRALTKHGNKIRKETRRVIEVGYSAPYAIYVHEAVDMVLEGIPRRSGIGVYWGPHGQAKYLEQPARELKGEIAQRVVQVTKSTKSIFRGMYSGGVLLRNASQYLVPVEYGELKKSAFINVTY